VPGAGFQKKVRSIPGAAPVVPGQASTEDAKKPRRKKKTEGDDGVVLPARDDLTEKSSTAGILSLPKAAATETVAPQPEGPTEKKIRKLSKKLREIEELKMAHASGKALEETQMLKITREDAVRKELAGLRGE